MSNKIIQLNGLWKVKFGSRWIPAQVPGDVHLDLAREGIISEPLFGDNLKDCGWIEEKEWTYKKEFMVDKARIKNADRVELIFYGLDTDATITLNDQRIGSHFNMFIPVRFDITGILKEGKNTLMVDINSGVSRVKNMDAAKYYMFPNENSDFPQRIFLRKAQFTFGWDWAPRLATCGIWRPVEVHCYENLCIRNVYLKSKVDRKEWAEVEVEVEIENFKQYEYEMKLLLKLERGKAIEKKDSMLIKSGINIYRTLVKIDNPSLWYPMPVGEPALYNFTLELFSKDKMVDQYKAKPGIREVRLLQEPMEDGKSFTFCINGIKVFCKGANWVPADSIIARVSRDKYKKLIDLAKEANFNMFRVWGGGIYEDPYFYQLCDDAGIMVWQDFMFACAYYPDDDEDFCQMVRREAESVVKSIRNHPSIVLWCGNNEIDEIYHFNKQKNKDRIFYGEKIYHKILPEVCSFLDPSRPYWPSSPYGGENPQSYEEGDRHSWWFWGLDDIETFRKLGYKRFFLDRARFVSEFGVLAGALDNSLEKFLPKSQIKLGSPQWRFHGNSMGTLEGVKEEIKNYFRVKRFNLERFNLLSQLIQGETIKHAVEHYRRRKFSCSGSLFWMYADCWGASTAWTAIDYYLTKRPLYYYLKRAFAPLLVSICEEEKELSVWITNDLLQDFSGVLEYGYMKPTGEILCKETISVDVKKNSSAVFAILDRYNCNTIAFARLKNKKGVISENRYFLNKFKELEGVEPKICSELQKIDNKKYLLRLGSNSFALFTYLRLPEGIVSDDNYFDLFPGYEKHILVSTNGKSIKEKDITIQTANRYL